MSLDTDRLHPDVLDTEAELISLEAHIDQLLDKRLASLDRVQAEALERMGGKLGRAGAALRITLGHKPGTLGYAIGQLARPQQQAPAYLRRGR